jgi:AraC family transcriptional regulator
VAVRAHFRSQNAAQHQGQTCGDRAPPKELAMTASPNRLHEPSLLAPSSLARWQGLPLAWVECEPFSLIRNVSLQRPALATLEIGAGEAEIAFAAGTEHLNVTAGAIGVFLPGEQRYVRWRCDRARRILVDLDVDFLAARELASEEMLSARLRQDLEFRDPDLSRVLQAMVREVADGCPNGGLYAESLSLGLALRVVRTLGSRTASERERGKLTRAQLARIDELIATRLDGRISLAMLAQAAGFSAPHLVRLMRNTAQCTPHQYVLRRRVARALTLLRQTDRSIAGIAAMTGFASQSHLTSTMVRIEGTTPGAVRRARRA